MRRFTGIFHFPNDQSLKRLGSFSFSARKTKATAMQTSTKSNEPPGSIAEFARLASRYSDRPEYPKQMVDHINSLLSLVPVGYPAVDIGAGTGLFTRPLARSLNPSRSVIGIEPSAEMRRAAEDHPEKLENVRYITGFAEEVGYASRSVALVAAACAAHRFDKHTFLAESHRILVPHGCLAIVEYRWGDTQNNVGDEIYSLLERLVDGYDRRAHSNSAGEYELFDAADAISSARLFTNVHQRAFNWTVQRRTEEVISAAMALTPSLKAEAKIGRETLWQALEEVIARHSSSADTVELNYVGHGTFALKRASEARD
ncbi:class I SAM-dependent methyltransferase [Mesorhizobium calcicola]|uniref:Class I SAM-dependent methyltransferase n=1 Tax=Mesorhizobium calcicola TaxID=1300310 RepID=A0ABW4WB66_9HYPH